jgi:hypothetical protein
MLINIARLPTHGVRQISHLQHQGRGTAKSAVKVDSSLEILTNDANKRLLN